MSKSEKLKIVLLKIDEEKEEIFLEDIPKDSSIYDIQLNIFCETGIEPSHQYLYYESPLDKFFFLSLDYIFKNKNNITKKYLIDNLSKILNDIEIKKISSIKKNRISRDFLNKFILENIESYLKTFNLEFMNSLEFIDISKCNRVGDSFKENKNKFNISELFILNNTLLMYSYNNIKSKIDINLRDEILKKYFFTKTYNLNKKEICDDFKKNSQEIIKIYKNSDNKDKFIEIYGKDIYNFIEYNIKDISFLIENLFEKGCDIQTIFNKIKLDDNLVFIKIFIKKKTQFYKIFKPKFLGKDANITKKTFLNWRNLSLDEKENDNFKSNSVIYFKIPYINNLEYITIYINNKGKSLVKVSSENIDLDSLKKIIFIFFKKISVITDSFNFLNEDEFLKNKNYKILNINSQLKINAGKNIAIKNLRGVLESEKNYIFSLDYPIEEKVFSYGYKRTNNFDIDNNLNCMFDKILIKKKITNTKIVKEYLSSIFINQNIDEKLRIFMENYKDETKEQYKLRIPFFTIFTKEGTFILNAKNLNNLNEYSIFKIFIANVFEKCLINKENKIEKNIIIKEDNSISSDLSKNNESLSNSYNSNKGGVIIGLDSESENSISNSPKNTNAPKNTNDPKNTNAPSIEKHNIEDIDISFNYEGKNYTEYMKTMRNFYDKILFSKKYKGKGYTVNCRRQPYIVSKQHFEKNINVKNQFNTLEGLDSKIIENNKLINGDDYFLNSHDNKKVYICPRIWCSQCNLPVNPIYFSENKRCPKCGGGQIEISKTSKMTKKKCVIVVKAENNYFKTDVSNKKNYLSKIFGNKKIPKELENLELRMIPKFFRANDEFPCCYKGVGNTKKNNKKISIKIEEKINSIIDQKIFRFITEGNFPIRKQNRISVLSNDIDYILDNSDTSKFLEKLDNISSNENKKLRELKNKNKITPGELIKLKELEIKKKGYEYCFNFYGKIRYVGLKKELNSFKYDNNYVSENLFRLSVKVDKNRSFLNCLEELTNLDGNLKSIDNIILDDKLFTPSLFCQLNNGNMIEIFKTDIDYDDKDFLEWKKIFKNDLKKLKIEENSTILNLYSSFVNFKKYHFSDSFKDQEFYLDLLGRKGILFDEDINILIIEKTNYEVESKLNILCPKSFLGQEHFNIENNTIILLTTGNYFEPIIGLRFIKKHIDIDKNINPFNPIFKFNYLEMNNSQINRNNISSIFKLVVLKCSENKENIRNNVFNSGLANLKLIHDNIEEKEIDKYIVGLNLKIIGVLLNNKLFIPIIPYGISNKLLNKLETKEYLYKNLIKLDKYLELLESKKVLLGYKPHKYIKDNNKIIGFLSNNGSVIPLEKSEIKIDMVLIENNDLLIDDYIVKGEKIKNEVIQFNEDYNNEILQKNTILYIFNNFIKEDKNDKIKQEIIKLIKNPVIPLIKKRKLIKKILESYFNSLFYFGDEKSINIKKTKKCYENKKKNCNDNCFFSISDNKCKNFITKKNILTYVDNKNKYLNYLIEELVRVPHKGLSLVNDRFDNITQLDFSKNKDELIFQDDIFDIVLEDLFRKKKQKYIRNINLFNTINQNSDIEINEEDIKDLKGKIKTVKKTERSPLNGSIVNLFGNKIKKPKIKSGKCIFPYRMTVKQKENASNTKKKSMNKIMNDCYPSIPESKVSSILGADGLFCPTEVENIYNQPENYNNRQTHKLWKKDKKDSEPYYNYESGDKKTNMPKGFCDMKEYIKRNRISKFKGKKINPKCIPKFKTKKNKDYIPTNYTENGTEYTCLVEDNISKIKDKFIPQLICPIEVDKDEVYNRTKNNNTESCFVDK